MKKIFIIVLIALIPFSLSANEGTHGGGPLKDINISNEGENGGGPR